jgi:hypothetical protein
VSTSTKDFYKHDYSKKWPNLNLAHAKKIGDDIGVNWERVDLGEFIQGIKEEQEHSGILGGDTTKVIEKFDYHSSGKIAYEHLLEVPKYYSLLEELEDKGKEKYPDTSASPRPKLASMDTIFLLPVTGSAVNMMPATSGKTIFWMTTER